MISQTIRAAALSLGVAALALPALAAPLPVPAPKSPAANSLFAAELVRCKLGSGKCGIDPKNQPGTFNPTTGTTIDDAADWLDDECEFYPGLCGPGLRTTASPGPTAPAGSAATRQ